MRPAKKILVAIVYEKSPKRLKGLRRETKVINTNAAAPLIHRMNKSKNIRYIGFFKQEKPKHVPKA